MTEDILNQQNQYHIHKTFNIFKKKKKKKLKIFCLLYKVLQSLKFFQMNFKHKIKLLP